MIHLLTISQVAVGVVRIFCSSTCCHVANKLLDQVCRQVRQGWCRQGHQGCPEGRRQEVNGLTSYRFSLPKACLSFASVHCSRSHEQCILLTIPNILCLRPCMKYDGEAVASRDLGFWLRLLVCSIKSKLLFIALHILLVLLVMLLCACCSRYSCILSLFQCHAVMKPLDLLVLGPLRVM